MTERHILTAMTYIDSQYIDAAQKKLGYLQQKQVLLQHHSGRALRRIFALAAAVMLLTSVLFVTALAVSEDFREYVFSFFRVEEISVIPEYTPETELSEGEMFVEPEGFNVGGVIEGRYVHTPVSSHARSGVYLICTDELEMKQGSHYDAYYEENGEFIKLEEHTFNRDYNVQGTQFHVEFDWVEYNGSVYMTWVDPDVSFRKANESGDASAALFTFNVTWQENGENGGMWYPVLLNLHTGELTDVLAGTGAERLSRVDNSAISEDQTKMLLGQDGENGYVLYYADLSAKKLYSINSLSGEEVDACSLIGEKLACWSLQDGYYKAWNIDLNTFERTELFDGIPDASSTEKQDAGIVFLMGFDSLIHWGDMYAGSSFALELDEAQNVYVIDLATGEKTQIQGFTWIDQVQRTPSPDGKKLLLAGGKSDEEILTFKHIGVLDFGNRRYVEFSRENRNDVYEYLAYWFDKNTVVIRKETMSSDMSSDYYLYSLAGEETVQKTEMVTVATQPTAAVEPEDGEFVKVTDYIPSIRQELGYAKQNNFTGQKIYDFTDAYLRYGTVKKLAKVSEELAEQGIGLKIWDGFRPLAAQEKLWEVCPDPSYVSHPVTGNRTHCRGNTVDVTLVNFITGKELAMPTGYDDFTALADRDYSDCAPEVAANACLLEQTMEKYGFQSLYSEWWHFTDEQDYPVEESFYPGVK